MRARAAVLLAATVIAAGAAIGATVQRQDGFLQPFDHPAINYYRAPTTDAVALLARDIDAGTRQLTWDEATGYLPSLLHALDISADSQVAVFSQTSFQAPLINPKNPRTVYFNDQAAVGYVCGGAVLEIAVEDPRQGVLFYTLAQKRSARPGFERNRECLRCHVSWDTFGVPGLFVLSTGPADKDGYASGGVVDQRQRIADRWGSWYLTGRMVPMHSMGTVLPSLAGTVDPRGYLTPYSDVVALMVLEHQTRMTNLLTDIGWEARVGAAPSRLEAIARELVDYLLFVNEAPLSGRIEGSSGYAERFSSLGPRDSRGRSLRQFDLERRLMRYPCSYMIYSAAFDALPRDAKAAVYDRMWQVLSGAADANAKYRRLSAADRQAVIEILRDTKRDLPASFRSQSDGPSGARNEREVERTGPAAWR